MSQVESFSPELVVKLVHYILNNSIMKLGIKRVDMITHALGGNAKLFVANFERSGEVLKEVYGYKIIEVPNKNPRQFICVSNIETATALQYTEDQRKTTTLLFLVLSYIFMKGGSLPEETVFQYLKKISITLDEPHHYFGSNVKKMLTDTLPKQMYLQREKQIVEGTSEETIVVSWGFRSELEFPKEAVLEEVAQLLRKPASSFVRQYDELHRDIEMEDVV